MDNKGNKKDDWIILSSKSRPGRQYKFNKATGETQWLSSKLEEETGKQKEETPPKISFNKSSMTPAQDRLKRLQHNLKVNQKCSSQSFDLKIKDSHEQENHLKQIQTSSSRISAHSFDEKIQSKKPHDNLLNEEPSTSKAKRFVEKSPKRPTKRSHSSSYTKDSKYPENLEDRKKQRITECPNPPSTSSSISMITDSAVNEEPKLSRTEIFNEKEEHCPIMEQNNGSTIQRIKTGIANKIKEICKIPFNVSKKITEGNHNAKAEKSNIINNTQFKHPKNSKNSKKLLSSSKVTEAIKHLREENEKTKNIKQCVNTSDASSPINLNIPSYPRGSANSRLERLKQSLIAQHHTQKQASTITKEMHTNNQNSKMSTEALNDKSISHLEENLSNNNDSFNSLYRTANNTIDNDVEAMDWQQILKDEDPIEQSNSGPTLVIEKSKKLVLATINANENQTMGDIYDIVNENLLRFSAEKQKDSSNTTKKWHTDYYYFVVDTNVLLKDLTFIEDLIKMKLCDTNGSVLYIPYAVLQELDKLKMRSGCQEGVKTLAVRAIKYLNSKFESNSPHLQAQSAIDERHRLVEINSADDSIINCCLQAKKYVPNLLFLTEDVNLRNKAICNNILVSNRSDLISKRYNTCDFDHKP